VRKAANWGSYAVGAILLLMPFHALLTVFLASKVGHYEALRLWKEVLLVLLLPLAGWIWYKSPGLQKRLRVDWLFWTVAAYVVLQVCLGVVALAKGQVNTYALLYAWVVNLRFFLIFMLAYVFASYSTWLRDRWKRLLVVPAFVVIIFGLLQATLLPYDFLRHFGYTADTLQAYQTVDNKDGYIRIQSTLRGANPFGAYMVLALAALLAIIQRRRRRQNGLAICLAIAGFGVLFASYSRSAYIGALVMVLALVLLVVRQRQWRQRLWWGLAVLALVLTGAFAALRTNDQFENTFFHTDEHSLSAQSSNEQRATALRSGVHDVLSEPFGRGPGTAGPASIHNSQSARIAENYYIQVGQEAGWIGLGLFVAVLVIVGQRLWRLRGQVLPRALLVSLLGISVVGLVQHVWTDDTLALVWWGFAGAALAGADMVQKQKTF
jgi:hypothetical protein